MADTNPAETIRRAATEIREHPERFPVLGALALADEMDIEVHRLERSLPDDSGSVHQWLRIARAYLGEADPS
jgi:hypothetical protein